MPAEPVRPPRSIRKLLLRLGLLAGVLMIAGCAARVGGLVEAKTFYMPSAAPFTTPDGIEDVTIPLGGRASLHGWWLPPPGDAERRGVILFCHGNAGNLPDHLAFVVGLRELGFGVLMFDYRGYGRSSSVNLLGRDTLRRDASAAHSFLRQHKALPGERIAIVGHSMGAVVGAAVVAHRPEAFDAAVLVAPFSSFPRVASDFAGPLGWALIPRGMATEEVITRFGETPVMLIHGDRDLVVRSYHTDRIERAAREAGVDPSVLRLNGADHVNVFDDQFGTSASIAAFIEAAQARRAAPGPKTNAAPDPAE